MRKSLIALCVLFLAVSLTAQIRTGNIFGKVVDPEENPLPGVTVTLLPPAGAAMTTVTTAEGSFRFLSLPPSKEYKIKAGLTGFKTRTEENIIVVVGGSTNLEIKMEMGVIEEQVTVTAVSPVVDTKKTSVGQNVTQEILQSMPTARDPWVVLQMVPSVTVDRENLGGTDSGQQAYFVAKGSDSGQNMWSVDGVLVTDPSAIGASPTYYDFDAFEEMRVTTGGGDITSQTGGVAMDLVTRRGGNKVSLGGRFYVTDPTFQAAYSPSKLADLGITRTNIIRGMKDYGFNVGGPIWKDKIWLWGSYGVQDIKENNLYGNPDDTLLTNYVAKLNIQPIPQNRFEIFLHSGNKEKFGRDATYSFPGGNHQTQRFHFGTPIWKAQDEHMFGDNLLMSLKFAYSHAGFAFLPMVNETLDKWVGYDETTQIYQNSYSYYITNRPMLQFNFYTNYFNDHLFGVSHDIKFGVEYSRRFNSTDSSMPGNTYYNFNYNSPTLSPGGTGIPEIIPGIQYISTWRGYVTDDKVLALAGYANDTITIGRLNLIVGLRYDYQKPYLNPFTMTHVNSNPVWTNYFTPAAKSAIDAAMPGLSVPGISGSYKWSVLSPRVGLTYDLTGDGKTILKASFAGYGEFMGTAEANDFYPEGTGGWMDFYWFDHNGDGKADISELFWYNPTTYAPIPAFDASGNVIRQNLNIAQYNMWGGYDYDNPSSVGTSRYTIDPNTNSNRTWEGIATIEREIMTDFAVALDLSYRKYNNYRWTREYYPDTGHIRNINDYVLAGQVPDLSSIGIDMGSGAGKSWYVLGPALTGSNFALIGPNTGYYLTYYAADLRFTKRLSNKWMLDGSFSYQNQIQHFGGQGEFGAQGDPTRLWALDGQVFSQSLGVGSGKISQYVFSHWMVKMEGLYQLPLDFNVSATFTARQGHINPQYMTLVDYTLPNPRQRSNTVYLDTFGSQRLPTFWNVNLRIEKMIKIGDTGRIYLMADGFNVFNNALMNRRYDTSTGTYYINTGLFVPNPTSFKANEVLNPRVVRFGVRFSI